MELVEQQAIHPLAVLVVTIGGGALFGAPGLILSAPLTAAAVRISADLSRARALQDDQEARRAPEPAPTWPGTLSATQPLPLRLWGPLMFAVTAGASMVVLSPVDAYTDSARASRAVSSLGAQLAVIARRAS